MSGEQAMSRAQIELAGIQWGEEKKKVTKIN